MQLFTSKGGRKPKDNNLPSMTEVVPQLSVEEIFRDYCRGVLHPARPGIYDPVESDEVEDVFEPEGIEDFDLYEKPVSAPAPKEPDNKEPAHEPESPAPLDS